LLDVRPQSASSLRAAQEAAVVKKAEVVQVNIRIRLSTKAALEQLAEEDRRSMADEADVLLVEAIEARQAAKAIRKGSLK
jgi:hypothetical protein